QHVLGHTGWRAELSDKGIYARESMELFGGFDGLVAALRDPAPRKLMDAFLARRGPGARLSHDNRRYLTWENLTTVASEPRDALHDLLQRGVLSRGLVLRCGHCRQWAWHSIGTVGDEFTCGRCRFTQPTERDS